MRILKKLLTSILSIAFVFPIFSQTTGTLSFTCNTAAPSGSWGDKHVAAIWIQNNTIPSIFVKTNTKYGNEDDHLTSWTTISKNNLVDAVTGATLTSYSTLSVEWDGTDVAHNVVMDGEYSIYIEMGWGKDKTNDHATSLFTFTKGSSAQELTPIGNDNYSAISVKWQPTATLISSVEDKDGICVFPNPSNGLIQLNFQKELPNAKIEVVDMAGRVVYSEKQAQIVIGIKSFNILEIPAGLYMLSITSENNHFAYKLLIE